MSRGPVFVFGFKSGCLALGASSWRAAGTTLSCAIVMWKFALLPHILMRLDNFLEQYQNVSNSNIFKVL